MPQDLELLVAVPPALYQVEWACRREEAEILVPNLSPC